MIRTAIAVVFLAACGDKVEPHVPAPVPLPAAAPATAAADAPTAPIAPSARPIPPAPTAVPESELTTTPSGLKYKDLKVCDGPSPAAGSVAVVEYTGWLTDGTMFDSSYKRSDPFKFPLGKGRVIPGWDEGVATMKVGGKRHLVVPAALAYGAKARPNIPADSTLIFEVELVSSRVSPPKPEVVAAQAFTRTESGLMFHDFTVGTGPSPEKGAKVTVDYTGWLDDAAKTKFDSSLDRAEGIQFPLGNGQVIKGWDEGIASMKEGGRRQLKIPADLAYGPAGRPPTIPPNSTLLFEVVLVDAGEGK